MGNDNGFRWWRPGDPDDKEAHRDWMRLVLYSDTCDEIVKEVSKMKIPVKDDVTIPWMSPREIPAVKAALSAWRKLRKDRQKVSEIRKEVMEDGWPHAFSCSVAEVCGVELEKLAALNKRLKKGSAK